MHERRWQYKVETVKVSAFAKPEKTDSLIEDRLTRLGSEGWQLVSTLPYGQYIRLFLKR